MSAEAGSSYGQTRGFLFSDLRGYTDYVERHGDDAAARLLERYRALVRGVVARHSGAEVRTEGDSFYVLFPSASSAVSAGLDIVASAARDSTDHPDAPIRVGVGVHAGETSDLPEGPVGSAVNMAARICAQAKAGEVLVSDTVRGLTRTRQVAVFTSVGSKRLKGIAEPVALYRAVAPGSMPPAGSHVITSRVGRPTTSRGTAVAVGALALVLVGLGGYALLNRGGGASQTGPPTLGGVANPTQQPSAAATPARSAGASATASADPTAVPITGTRVIYSRQHVFGEGRCDESPPDAKLYVLDPDHPEMDPYRLTYRSNLIEISPAWSGDGATVAFIGSIGRGAGGLNTVDVSRDNLKTVATPYSVQGIDQFAGNRALVSSDGETIFHLSSDSIWRTPIQGGETQPVLLNTPAGEPDAMPVETFLDVASLDDGRLLVLVGPFEGDGETQLERVSADGAEREPLDLDLSGMEGLRSFAVNGDVLALVGGTSGQDRLWVGSLDAGREGLVEVALDLTGTRNINLSPDRAQLVVQADAEGGTQIYAVDVASGESRQLTDDPDAIACRPVWRQAPMDMAQPLPAPEPGTPLPFELGKLEPGTYLNDFVTPAVSLTFPEGWFSRRSYVDGWSVFRESGQPGELTSARLQIGYLPGCDPENRQTVLIDTEPIDVIQYLQSRTDLVATPANAINLGGYPGLSIDVTGKPAEGCGDDPEFQDWILFTSGEDTLGLVTGEHMRLIALDVRGTTVSFPVFTYPGGDPEAYWRESAEPVLRTVAFPAE